MENENRIIGRFETVSKYNKRDIDTVLGLFWLVICLDYFVYFQNKRLTEDNKKILNRKRLQIQSQFKNILKNDGFEHFQLDIANAKLEQLDDLENPGERKRNYDFFGVEYPKHKIYIMHNTFMKKVMPVSGVYIDEDLCRIVLYNFNKIIEECGFNTKDDSTIDNSSTVKTYNDLMRKLRDKMIYINTFEFEETMFEFPEDKMKED